jgi:hypothetical protein
MRQFLGINTMNIREKLPKNNLSTVSASVAIVPDPNHPAPVKEVAGIFSELYDKGVLPGFIYERQNMEEAFDGLGNCHMIAIAFMTDVAMAKAEAGWSWVEGHCKRSDGFTFKHSWLEYSGCAVEANHTPILVMSRWFYRKHRKVHSPKVRTAKQFRKWMCYRSGRNQ